MNKTLVITAFAALAFCGATWGDGAAKIRPRRSSKPSGGLVIGQAADKHICFLNASSQISKADLENAARAIVLDVRAPIVVVDAKGPETLDEKIAAAKKDPTVAFVIPFVDNPGADMLSYHPDRDLCVVNVKALGADGADHKRLSERVGKQAWRAVGMMLGAGDSVTGFTVLRRAKTLAELDANRVMAPSPEQHNQMVDGLKPYGITMVRIGTYRSACEQGWASQPTNEEQKAIWNEVHTTPTKPIIIKPETKKQN